MALVAEERRFGSEHVGNVLSRAGNDEPHDVNAAPETEGRLQNKMRNTTRLTQFCRTVELVVAQTKGAESAAGPISHALQNLLSRDDWLKAPWRKADSKIYQQHPIYIDEAGRFSIVSFVWTPGQATPIHDHGVWGVVGVLCGAEFSQRYRSGSDGRMEPDGPPRRMEPGDVEILSPSQGDIHRVWNACDDRASISIHVYGADIGRLQRHSYLPDGGKRMFVSGYSSTWQAHTPGPASSSCEREGL